MIKLNTLEHKIWFTSDLHFGHNKEFLYKPRGFNSIEEHDESIINNFNSVVSNDDKVFILGDLMLVNNDNGIECLKKLNGKKYFIIGNHDTDSRLELYKNINLECLGYSTLISINKYHLYLSHYPSTTGNYDSDKPLKTRIINISGHTHFKEKFNNLTGSYNVALDAHNNFPVEFNTIIADIKENLKDNNEE